MSDNPYVVRHQDMEVVAWVASRMASDAHAVDGALIRSLTHEARMNEARYALAVERVLRLLDGPYAPSGAAIERALLVSNAVAEKWLEDTFIGDWRDPASSRKGW